MSLPLLKFVRTCSDRYRLCAFLVCRFRCTKYAPFFPLVLSTLFRDFSRSCHVSDSGGTAVYSPEGPGGSRARSAGHAAAVVARSAWGGKERPVFQVLQAGQDEISAGSGAVAVSISQEELSQACLIGQVRGVSRGGQQGRKVSVQRQVDAACETFLRTGAGWACLRN